MKRYKSFGDISEYPKKLNQSISDILPPIDGKPYKPRQIRDPVYINNPNPQINNSNSQINDREYSADQNPYYYQAQHPSYFQFPTAKNQAQVERFERQMSSASNQYFAQDYKQNNNNLNLNQMNNNQYGQQVYSNNANDMQYEQQLQQQHLLQQQQKEQLFQQQQNEQLQRNHLQQMQQQIKQMQEQKNNFGRGIISCSDIIDHVNTCKACFEFLNKAIMSNNIKNNIEDKTIVKKSMFSNISKTNQNVYIIIILCLALFIMYSFTKFIDNLG
jgi:small-conductance mechanosensitive channel